MLKRKRRNLFVLPFSFFYFTFRLNIFYCVLKHLETELSFDVRLSLHWHWFSSYLIYLTVLQIQNLKPGKISGKVFSKFQHTSEYSLILSTFFLMFLLLPNTFSKSENHFYVEWIFLCFFSFGVFFYIFSLQSRRKIAWGQIKRKFIYYFFLLFNEC